MKTQIPIHGGRWPRNCIGRWGRSTTTARISVLGVLLLAGWRLAPIARAHDPLLDLPAPTSRGEAWNIITQSLANVETCLKTRQLADVTPQIANCSPAIRFLQAEARRAGDKPLADQLEKLYYTGDAVITATRAKGDPLEKARAALAIHRAALGPVMAKYTPDVLGAQVYVCPMHPLERGLDPAAPCPKCSMRLIRRRIPASTTYEKPGAPSMKLSVRADRPLKVGRKANVTISLANNNGKPVTRGDLLTMHTEKIHLLIVDGSLADYHHEHPRPAEKAGDYTFSFTPLRSGPYRIFADVVPAETSMQEYVVADLPAEGAPGPAADKATRLASEAGGFKFILKFDRPAEKLRAGEPITGQLTVIAPDETPYKELQPVMGAFAHLVAFNEDHRTVLHIHPQGIEPTNPKERGGPTLTFKLYAPKAGFYRLYAQTRIMDEDLFAPFNLTIEEGAKEGR